MHVQSPTLKTSVRHFAPMTGAKWQWQCKWQLPGLALVSQKDISETPLGFFTPPYAMNGPADCAGEVQTPSAEQIRALSQTEWN